MKNKNFTLMEGTMTKYSLVVLLFLFAIGFAQKTFAQTPDPINCPLSCNDNVQVSLQGDCKAVITPEMVIEGENDNYNCPYKIYSIKKANGAVVGAADGTTGNWILNGDATPDYTYQDLTVEVGYDPSTGNVCWGKIRLEDKLPPTIRCLDSVWVSCSEDLSDYLTTDTDAKYQSSWPYLIPNSVGPNFGNFPILLANGQSVQVPFTVTNKANQSEILNLVQALVTSTSLTGLTVTISDPNGYVSGSLNSPYTDNSYYGKQATNDNIQGLTNTKLWYVTVTNNSGSSKTLTDVQLRIKSTGFLRIGNGVIVSDNCHLSLASIKILSDNTIVNSNTCGPWFRERKIQYQGVDWRGMKTPVCTHVIRWEHKGFNDMAWPHNYDNIDSLGLSCSGYFLTKDQQGDITESTRKWDTNGDGYPQPGEVDVPTIDGNPIWPNMGYCMMNVLYTDEIHELCPGSFKILRKWIAYDMCEAGSDGCCNGGDNPRTHYQLIKVLDVTPITFETYPGGIFTVSTKPFSCTADVKLPIPTIQNYGCSNNYTYEVGYCSTGDGLFEYFSNITYTLVNGIKQYTIKDLPEGTTCVRYRITDACGNISDGTLTVNVIDDVPPIPVCDEHTVATVSTDCTARVYAETFDDGSFDNCTEVTFTVAKMNGTSLGTFGPYLDYGSGDVGQTRTVVLKVTDQGGLWNTCMVQIRIEDKIGPTITCPANKTVDCNVDPHNVALTGGEPTYADNCSATITHTDNGTLTQCNVGTITRTWVVTDNGGRTASCSQTITVQDGNPFVMLAAYWPNDVLNLVGCSNTDTDPSKTGEPNLSADDYCSMVASTYKDRLFSVVNGACYKILRDWTVIDWCQYDDHNPVYLGYAGNPYKGMWTHTQVIMVSDNNLPTFTSSCANQEICAYNSDCTGDVTLTATGSDQCTPANELVYTYKVFSGTTVFAQGSTNTFTKSHMALGTYQIQWTVEDKCGNLATCSYSFTVKDCKNPTPLCYSEITTVVMPSTTPRMVTIKARDFDRGSTDNCNPGASCGHCYTDLRFSFSGTNPKDSVRTFTESQVGLNQLDMWVWDVAGNRDFCTVTVYIQDNVGTGHLVAGLTKTTDNKKVGNVIVRALETIGHEGTSTESTSDGIFQFNLPENSSYELSAEKTDEYINGLTTLDLVLIQKHLLEIKKFDDPYKMLAADANNDNKVSASDIQELRSLLLGKTNVLNNKPWIFVNSKYEFANNNNPWSDMSGNMESILVDRLTTDALDNNFVALKIGDVNNSVVLNNTSGLINPRSVSEIMYDDVNFKSGQILEIPFYTTQNIEGMQLRLNIDPAKLALTEVLANEMKINEKNYNVSGNDVTLSWNQISDKLDITKPIFTMKFKTLSDGRITDAIELNDKYMDEVYDNNLETYSIRLKARNSVNDFMVYQNTPNPFSNNTEISFSIPENDLVRITIYDLNGKVLMEKSKQCSRGLNSVSVSTDDLKNVSGVLYYKVECNNNSDIKKMVLMSK